MAARQSWQGYLSLSLVLVVRPLAIQGRQVSAEGAAHAACLRGQTGQRGPRHHQVGGSSGGFDNATLPLDLSL